MSTLELSMNMIDCRKLLPISCLKKDEEMVSLENDEVRGSSEDFQGNCLFKCLQ